MFEEIELLEDLLNNGTASGGNGGGVSGGADKTVIQSEEQLTRIVIALIVLYSVTAGVLLASTVYMYFAERKLKKAGADKEVIVNPKLVCLVILFVCAIIRIIWAAFVRWGPTADIYTTFILNRVVFCLTFTAFGLILALWADSLIFFATKQSKLKMSFYSSKKILWGFIVTNVIIYLGQLAFIMTFVGQSVRGNNDSVAYDINILLIVGLSMIMAVAFLIFGVGLLAVTSANFIDKKKRIYYALKIITITSLIAACFVVKFIMFLYRPATGKFFANPVFYTFAYIIPEIVPAFLVVFIVLTSKIKEVRSVSSNSTRSTSS